MKQIRSSNYEAAFYAGYRVTKEGLVRGKHGKIMSPVVRGGRPRFRMVSTEAKDVRVDRLQAFQKFGYAAYYNKFDVVHLDGDKLNNSWDNIAIRGKDTKVVSEPTPFMRIDTDYLAIAHTGYAFHRSVINEHWIRSRFDFTLERFGIESRGYLDYVLTRSNAAQADKVSANVRRDYKFTF